MFYEILEETLRKRRQQLDQYIAEQNKLLRHAPEGRVRISSSSGRTQYYLYSGGKEEYLRDRRKAAALAQKMYAEKVVALAGQEKNVLDWILRRYPVTLAEDIYEQMSEARQNLIEPIRQTNAEFVKEWESFQYTGKGFWDNSPVFMSDRGERVRSKSELLIANYLHGRNIPYRYECPLELKGSMVLYPDFRILNVRRRKEYIYEHFGMMDDPEYAEKAALKLGTYMENGIFPGEKLLFTFETRNYPINMKQFELLVRKYCK